MRELTTGVAKVVAALTLLGTTTLPAQGVRTRVTQVTDGQVRFTVPVRPDVCGSGSNIYRTSDSRQRWNNNGNRGQRDVEYDVECDAGPGRVVIETSRGRVTAVRFYVGGRWRPNADATDFGRLSGREGADVLLDIARAGDGKDGEWAIYPLSLIDSVVVWPQLMALARDEGRPRRIRTQAVFWLGQLAEEPATAGLDELVGEAALDREVREQAVFALSQRPRDEGVPALINVVRTNKDPEMRRKALFWLGQSKDPRGLALIEELLAKR